MSDTKLLNTAQIVNSIAVLFSFFLGYKYALKKNKKLKGGGGGGGVDDDGAVASAETPGASGGTSLFGSLTREYKMVLVVRNDLGMSKGKIAAQCSHGAVGAYQKAIASIPYLVKAWDNTGCAKVALKVNSEAELIAIKRAAERRNLNVCLIRDAGRTQIEPNSKTVLAIGPADVEIIDQVTGHLKLL
uniref:peptidyl-tRNA hydrolase n=1 Tax=Glossina brevipalpis TaxID=37001 RepID=A0A1A9WHT1_9MUSC